jgi:hypothetical protein
MPRGRTQRTKDLIAACHAILAEIAPATVRAVCYRLFTMGLLASMAKTNTNKVSTALVAAREEELIPWHWIVDETREAERISAWNDLAAFSDVVQRAYRRDRWVQQPQRVEVWSEKGTVRGTLGPVLQRYAVTFRVMHGYASATAINEVADETAGLDEPLLVLYAGDWDPSGLHMSEVDLPSRLAEYGANVTIRRIALSQDDVASGGLPSFLAETKRQDPRWQWFTRRYGERCWELDALSPVVLRERVEQEIVAIIDAAAWERAAAIERVERASLADVMGRWREAISMQATE